jgi:carbon monoxide dehydrogenase subunit G
MICARSNPSSVNHEGRHTMNIQDEFKVGVPVEEAWRVFLDVERIAPCMPGAQLQEVEGDEYRGIVKVKVGPITAQYKGAARIVEADEAARRIVIKAEGRDTRGQGNASATVTAALAPDGDGTKVNIDTDLNVTGKVAQFGRGVMADVSTKLLGQFVTCLHETVLAPGAASGSNPAAVAAPDVSDAPTPAAAPTPATAAPAQAPATPPASAVRKIDAPEAAPVDLMKAAGGAVMKRAVPAAIAAVVVVGLVVWLLTR